MALTCNALGGGLFTMTNVVISGPHGRMGEALCRLASAGEQYNLVGALVRPGSPIEAQNYPLFHRLAEAKEKAEGPLVLIDFTSPEATMERLEEAAELGVPVVIGTTGFSAEQVEQVVKFGERIPVLLSANMSLGVNLLLDVVESLARRLPEYDIEITETHHRLKKDAPSGTALLLGRAAAQGRDWNLDEVLANGREGLVGERPARQIGMHALRGGDVVGDHTVLFAGLGERVEVTHKASSRDTFASGALFAAKYLAKQGAGFYNMRDALGLG